MAKRSNEWTVC